MLFVAVVVGVVLPPIVVIHAQVALVRLISSATWTQAALVPMLQCAARKPSSNFLTEAASCSPQPEQFSYVKGLAPPKPM